MPLRFFNTYSRELEDFAPRENKKVGIYTCGPTVYSRAHIGNFRAYIFEDLLQRHLEARGFSVHRVMNITDVDDKTIRGAREANVPLQKFTQQFKDAFFEDADTLRIKRADEYPSATDQRYIAKMIAMINALISKGLAYQADDKSVYYRINKFPNYGKLAHLDLAELQTNRARSARRVRQGTHRRFRLVEGLGRRRWRCEMGFTVGTRAARLAHRVQRDGDRIAWRSDRHSLRRRR